MKKQKIQSYFTYANIQTSEGKERLMTVIKIFYAHIGYEKSKNLNINLSFYDQLIKDKSNARYIVFTIIEKDFGLGIFTEKEIKDGKKISKYNNYLHQYVDIGSFLLKINYFLTRNKKEL